MPFSNFFKNVTSNDKNVEQFSSLFRILQKEFPKVEEDQLLKASCVAGLFARVAYVDFNLDPEELKKIEHLLNKWDLKGIEPKSVSDIAVNHIKEMAGLENHLYVKPLNQMMDKDERFNTVKALFLIAASDGNVESVESEEIRLITKGLELSHQHFVAARAEVLEFLNTLK